MIYRFLLYGLIGWGLEIFWTGLGSAVAGDVRLSASTYLWMFPIYGMAILMEPIHHRIRAWPFLLRGLVWLLIIWIIEYGSGGMIRSITGSSPWDYTGTTPWQVNGLIRLDMAPLWMITGFLFERIHDFFIKHLTVSHE